MSAMMMMRIINLGVGLVHCSCGYCACVRVIGANNATTPRRIPSFILKSELNVKRVLCVVV